MNRITYISVIIYINVLGRSPPIVHPELKEKETNGRQNQTQPDLIDMHM